MRKRLPDVVAGYPISASASWRLSSLLFAVVWSTVFFVSQARLRRVDGSGISWGSPFYRRSPRTVWTTIVTLLLASVSGLFGPLESVFHVTALLVSMMLAAVFFIRVLLILAPANPPD